MANKERVTTEQVKTALKASGGWQSKAAEMLKISPQALSVRIKKNKGLQDLLLDIKSSYLDLCESKLISKINDGDLGAICFYLKCQGKQRGYIEKSQHEHSGIDGGAIQTNNKIVIEYVDSDKDEN